MINEKLGQYIGVLIVAIILVCCVGCASTDPITIPGETIYVTDYKKPDPLPVPERPLWKLLGIEDEAGWEAWLEAQSLDLGACLDWSDQLLHVIESYNEAINETESPTE